MSKRLPDGSFAPSTIRHAHRVDPLPLDVQQWMSVFGQALCGARTSRIGLDSDVTCKKCRLILKNQAAVKLEKAELSLSVDFPNVDDPERLADDYVLSVRCKGGQPLTVEEASELRWAHHASHGAWVVIECDQLGFESRRGDGSSPDHVWRAEDEDTAAAYAAHLTDLHGHTGMTYRARRDPHFPLPPPTDLD